MCWLTSRLLTLSPKRGNLKERFQAKQKGSQTVCLTILKISLVHLSSLNIYPGTFPRFGWGALHKYCLFSCALLAPKGSSRRWVIISFGFKYTTYDRSRPTAHPKFDPTGVRTQAPDHDSTFHVTETLALITRPSMTWLYYDMSWSISRIATYSLQI